MADNVNRFVPNTDGTHDYAQDYTDTNGIYHGYRMMTPTQEGDAIGAAALAKEADGSMTINTRNRMRNQEFAARNRYTPGIGHGDVKFPTGDN